MCTTPWCEAPIAHADHTTPAREGGATSFEQGAGTCARCNEGKEAPGWRHRVTYLKHGDHHRGSDQHLRDHDRNRGGDGAELGARVVQVTTPLGHQYVSEPPPLLGWGSETKVPPPQEPRRREHRQREQVSRRKRPLRRPRAVGRPSSTRRPRSTSHLERQLCRYLA